MDQQTEENCIESITLLSDGGETTISKLAGREYGGLDLMNVGDAGYNEKYNDLRGVEYYDQCDAYTRHGLDRNEDQDPDQDYGAIPVKSKNKSFKEESSISSDRSTLSSITNNDVVPMYDDNGHFVAYQNKGTQQAEMQVLQQQLLLHHKQSNLTVPHLPMHLYRQPSLANRQTSFQTPPMSNLTVPQLPLQLHLQPSPIKSSRTDTTSTLANTPHKSLPSRSQLQYDDAVSGNTTNNDRHVGFNACFCCKVGSLIALFAFVAACSATATWFVITDRVLFIDGKLNINIQKGKNLEQSDPVEFSTLTPSLTPRVRISKSGKLGISMFGPSNQNIISPTQEEINSDMRPTLPNLLDLKPASKRDNTDSPSQQTVPTTRRPLSKTKTMSPTDGMTLSPSDTLVREESISIQLTNKPKRRPTARPVTLTDKLTPSPFETSEQTNTPKRRPSLKPIAPSSINEPTSSPSEFVMTVDEMITDMPVRSDVTESSSSPRTTSPYKSPITAPLNRVTIPPTYNTPTPSVLDPINTTLMPISSPSSAPDYDHHVQVELMTSKPTPIELDTEEPTDSPVVELVTPTPSDKQSSNQTDPLITTEPTETHVELMTPPPIPPADKENPSITNPPIATPLLSSLSPSPTLKVVRMTPTPTTGEITTKDTTESPVDQKAPYSLLPAKTSSNPTEPPIVTPLTSVPTQEVVQVTPSPTLSQIDTEDPTPIELMTPLSTPAATPAPTVSGTTESTPDPTPYPTFESTQDSTPAQSALEIITDTPTEESVDENEVTLMPTGDGSITSINSYAPTSDDELV